MAKKKNPQGQVVKPVAPQTTRKAPARKPKAKAPVDSQMKKTILSAPRAVNLQAASSFMRTTAFTLQNKVRTAMTGLSKIEKSEKTPSARLGLSYDTSMEPTSSESFFAKPFNRFKIAFLTVVMVGGVAGYMYSDRVIDGFKSLGDAVTSVSHEKTWVDGMMKETNGVPDDAKNGELMPPRMHEETVVPVADEAPAAAPSDVLPTEPTLAAPAPAPKAVEEVKVSKPVKAVKKGKAAKGKAGKSKARKGKSAH